MFDPLWLSSFLTVAETRSFTAAAARLGIGQPTVSEHVRKLEAACGRRLFIRDTHKVLVTPDGEAMLGFAGKILEINAQALRHFSDDEIYGRVRLGVSEDVVLRGLPQALRRFINEHPRVELELTVGLSETLRDRLNAGDLDLVFIKRRVDETHGTLVWREPLVWIAAPDFQIDSDRPVPLVVLPPPSLTRSAALAVLGGIGRQWRVVCASGSQSGIHAAVSAGLGVAPHARSLAPADLIEVPENLLPPLGEIEFAVIGRRGSETRPVRALITMLETSGSQLRNCSFDLKPARVMG
jgi:DNA-binding transcriptional LysR family regulator